MKNKQSPRRWFDDGRYFYIQQSFCIGYGGPQTGEWNSNYATRLYSKSRWRRSQTTGSHASST